LPGEIFEHFGPLGAEGFGRLAGRQAGGLEQGAHGPVEDKYFAAFERVAESLHIFSEKGGV